jgi:hypothetical protein
MKYKNVSPCRTSGNIGKDDVKFQHKQLFKLSVSISEPLPLEIQIYSADLTQKSKMCDLSSYEGQKVFGKTHLT